MIAIRDEQFQSLEREAREAFVQELLAHCREFSPKHAKAIRDEGVLEVIRLGIARAESHGFTFRGPIRLYVELMFKLGSGFDTDPLLPWAAAALADKKDDQMVRADRLFAEYERYDASAIGSDAQFARAAAKKGADLDPSELDLPAGADRRAALVAAIKQRYPEKAAAVGDDLLGLLMPMGERMAAKHELGTPRAHVLFAVLIFVFGHHVDSDPLYPWVKGTLANERADSVERRIERVATKTLAFAGRAKANMDRS